MGCAGSKPHHLLSSSMSHHHHHHHANSPQKGFILFNSKTVEYLKAHEPEIRAKLVERCEHKLLRAAGSATTGKSLFGTSKRSFLPTSASAEPTEKATATAATTNGTAATTATAASKTFSVDKISELNKFKESAIESAVDYVLKYAVNDFDIENFKSSNHLSMKQIRKDIMKKNSASGVSLSKLAVAGGGGDKDASTVSATAGASLGQLAGASGGTLKSSESAFYKLALNTTIDEFGLFIQENFVVINEFKAKQDASKSETAAKTENGGAGGGLNAEEEAALKLKEALELARQNFYKGKMSMVCLTKTGGYVVKEVKDGNETATPGVVAMATDVQTEPVAAPVEEAAAPATPVKAADAAPAAVAETVEAKQSSPITPENLNSAKTVTILDPQTNQKSKVAISSKINIEDVDISATFKIIETNQNEFAAAAAAAAAAGVAGCQPPVAESPLNTSTASHTELTAAATKKTSRSSLRFGRKTSKSKTPTTPTPTAVVAAPEPVAAVATTVKAETLAEFAKLKSDLSQVLNEAVESMVAFATKPIETEAETPSTTAVVVVDEGLESKLKKAKEVVEMLDRLDEKEYALIDEKLVESAISLDYVNREFKNYVHLLQEAKSQQDAAGNKGAEVAALVDQLDALLAGLPKQLFSAKGLPHPADVNAEEPAPATQEAAQTPVVAEETTKTTTTAALVVQSVSPPAATKPKSPAKATPKTPNGLKPDSTTPKQKSGRKKKAPAGAEALNGGGSSKKSSPFKKIIDIKKEIAISILNVGEVLAKTIDYYSLSSGNNAKDSEDLKELIKISEQQAAKQQQQPTSVKADAPAPVSVVPETTTVAAAETKTPEVKAEEAEKPEEPVQVAEIKTTEETVVEAKPEVETEEKAESEVAAGTVEAAEVAPAPVDEMLQVNVLAEQAVEVVAKDAVQQSTTASSLSSPTLSTTSSLSGAGTGSSSPVPPISSSSSEPQQLSNGAVEAETTPVAPERRHVTAEATSESTPVMPTSERVVAPSDTESTEGNKLETLPSADLLIESTGKTTTTTTTNDDGAAVIETEAEIELPKHAAVEMDEAETRQGGQMRREISLIVKEMKVNAETGEKLVLLDESALAKTTTTSTTSGEEEEAALASESSSDLLHESSSSGKEELTAPAAVVFRSAATDSSASSNGSSFGGIGGGTSKRMSLDEELMYQLEEVDKKVKYMNETCSENEGDEDDDEDDAAAYQRRLDELANEELDDGHDDDDELLFHPRTPAKIKSEVREQRKADIQEEIKQISSVIQDLVQTINVVKNGGGGGAALDNISTTTTTTTTDAAELYKTPQNSSASTLGERKRSTASGNSKRSSVSSTHSTSYSSIPVRQSTGGKMLTKQRATSSIEDETPASGASVTDQQADDSFKSAVNTSEIFAHLDSSPSSKKFKSKLPVKK